MAYYIRPPVGGVLNDPKDSSLGNSYTDGVERARRVKIQKKKMRDPNYLDPSTILTPEGEGGKISPEDTDIIESVLGKAGGDNTWSATGLTQSQLDDLKRIKENSDLIQGGFDYSVTGKDREAMLEELKRRKANRPAGTILG